MQAQPPPPPPPPRGGPQPQAVAAKQKMFPKPSPGKGMGFNASLNPKAEPFVPKTNNTTTPGKPIVTPTISATQATIPGPVTCPVCGDSGFITHNVLRSHMKAKHPNVPEPRIADDAAHPPRGTLHATIASYIEERAGTGSVPLSQLQGYIADHAQEFEGESALQHATSFPELMKSLGFVVFAYTEDQLNDRRVPHSFIAPNEVRIAAGSDYYDADATRATQGHQE